MPGVYAGILVMLQFIVFLANNDCNDCWSSYLVAERQVVQACTLPQHFTTWLMVQEHALLILSVPKLL